MVGAWHPTVLQGGQYGSHFRNSPERTPVAKVVALNVRYVDRFRPLFINPAPIAPPLAPLNKTSPLEAGHNPSAQKGVALSDASIGQFREGEEIRPLHTVGPEGLPGLFPEDPKLVTSCPIRELRIPLIDSHSSPIAVKQQRFSPEQTGAIRRKVELFSKRHISRTSTSAWAARCVTMPEKDGTLRL